MSARPATSRRSRATTAVRPGPARVRDFSRTLAAVSIEWDVRTAFDFVFSLSDDAGATDDIPGPDRLWLRSARTSLEATVGEGLKLYGSEFCVVLAGLAIDHPEVQDARAFVDLVAGSSRQAILRTVLYRSDGAPEDQALTERALSGDDAALQARVEALTSSHDLEERDRLVGLFRDPDRAITLASEVLTGWLPYFSGIETRIRGMLERDVQLREHDRRTLDPAELIERTTGGVRWLSEPGVGRVILAPSYFARPYNFLLAGDDWRLFGYPIADAALDAGDPLAPPPAVLRLHRALGDETRLRILRLLRDRDLYLTEIAQLLELSKPTIKHHLAQLRAAGLVTVTEEGAVTYYSLRRDRIEDVGLDLAAYLR